MGAILGLMLQSNWLTAERSYQTLNAVKRLKASKQHTLVVAQIDVTLSNAGSFNAGLFDAGRFNAGVFCMG